MAGDAVVGALRVVLGLDTGSFEDGAKKAGNQISNFGNTVKAVFEGVLGARVVERLFDALAHSFKETVVQAFEFADQMGKMAQKTGTSVEALSGLKLAADLSDVSMESLSAGLGKLSKAITETGQGTGDAKKYFEALGISVRDSSGNLKSATDLLPELADKFAGAADGSAKVTAALALLGRGGKELIPLLNEGGASLKEFREIAQRMGLEVGENTKNQVTKFNDNMKLAGHTMQGIGNLVVAELIPGFLRLSQSMADNAKSGDFIRSTADIIVRAFKQIIVWAIQLWEELKTLGQVFGLIIDGVDAAFKGMSDILDRATKPIRDKITAIIEAITAPFAKIGVFFTEIGTAIVDKVGGAISWIVSKLPGASKETEALKESMSGLSEAFKSEDLDKARAIFDQILEKLGKLGTAEGEAARKKMEELFTQMEVHGAKAAKGLSENIDKVGEAIQRLQLQAKVIGGAFDNLPTGFPELAASLDLIHKNGDNLSNSMVGLKGRLLEVATAQAQLNAAQVKKEMMDPLDVYDQKLKQLKLDLDIGGLSAENFAKASAKAAAEMGVSFGAAAQAVVGPMAQAFATLAQMNSKYAGIAKAAAIASATVATFEAANKAYAAFAYFPPLAIAAAGAAVAAGLANVAKIVATPTNFAQGGQFKVGGVGGIDSQLVQFNATPGEMVDVRKPGQAAAAPSEITVNLRGRELINRDMIRDLFAALNDGTRDGYRLKLAEA